MDRLSRALPGLVARLGEHADADAEKAAAKHAWEIEKLCDVANRGASELAEVLGTAEALACTLVLARLQVDGLSDTAGTWKGGTHADPSSPLAGEQGTGTT